MYGVGHIENDSHLCYFQECSIVRGGQGIGGCDLVSAIQLKNISYIFYTFLMECFFLREGIRTLLFYYKPARAGASIHLGNNTIVYLNPIEYKI